MKLELKDIPFFEAINLFIDNKNYTICINGGEKELYFKIIKGKIEYVNVPLDYLIPKLGEAAHKENLSPDEIVQKYQASIAKRYLEEMLSELHENGTMQDIKGEVQSAKWCRLDIPICLGGISGIELYYTVVKPDLSEYKSAGINEEALNRLFSDFATT